MEITPQLDRIIADIAEAKMHMLLAIATQRRSPDRQREVDGIERSTKRVRELLVEYGGFEKLPRHLAVELRVCEMSVIRLREPREKVEP